MYKIMLAVVFKNGMFRWRLTFIVTTTFQARQRVVANERSGDDFVAEFAPFQCDACDNTGHYEICIDLRDCQRFSHYKN